MHPYRETDVRKLGKYTIPCLITKDVVSERKKARCACGMIMTVVMNGCHCHGCGKTILNNEGTKDE